MSAFRLRLEIEGDGEAIDTIKRIGDRGIDAKPVMKVIQELMLKGSIEHFNTEGARGGFTWKQDLKATVERKQHEGLNTKTEMRHGDLRDSLTVPGSGEFADEIRRVNKTSTTFGTRRFYAVFQGKMRKLLQVTLEDANLWSEKMATWLLTGKV